MARQNLAARKTRDAIELVLEAALGAQGVGGRVRDGGGAASCRMPKAALHLAMSESRALQGRGKKARAADAVGGRPAELGAATVRSDDRSSTRGYRWTERRDALRAARAATRASSRTSAEKRRHRLDDLVDGEAGPGREGEARVCGDRGARGGEIDDAAARRQRTDGPAGIAPVPQRRIGVGRERQLQRREAHDVGEVRRRQIARGQQRSARQLGAQPIELAWRRQST